MVKDEFRTCEWPECVNEARGDRLCAAHRKRLQRSRHGGGTPMSAPMRPRCQEPWERLTAAVLNYAEASAEDERAYQLARDRLRKAVMAYQEGPHQPNQHRKEEGE